MTQERAMRTAEVLPISTSSVSDTIKIALPPAVGHGINGSVKSILYQHQIYLSICLSE